VLGTYEALEQLYAARARPRAAHVWRHIIRLLARRSA
jgi:hypothetical protein